LNLYVFLQCFDAVGWPEQSEQYLVTPRPVNAVFSQTEIKHGVIVLHNTYWRKSSIVLLLFSRHLCCISKLNLYKSLHTNTKPRIFIIFNRSCNSIFRDHYVSAL